MGGPPRPGIVGQVGWVLESDSFGDFLLMPRERLFADPAIELESRPELASATLRSLHG